MPRWLPQLLMWVFIASLSACASSPTTPPVQDNTSQAPITRDGDVTQGQQGPVSVDEAATEKPASSAATASLLASAQAASKLSNHSDAVNFLERAIRIEPRDGTLWIALSEAHLNNGNTSAAQQHARKAIALAAHHKDLSRQAWLQLARVYEAQGQTTKALAITQKFQPLPG